MSTAIDMVDVTVVTPTTGVGVEGLEPPTLSV